MAGKNPLHVVGAGGASNESPGGIRHTLRILVVDDDRDTATMLAIVLRTEGHEVQIALRGDEALEVSRLLRPDVVIADLNLPGESGFAIARELRVRHGELAPMLIAISGQWTKTSDRLVSEHVGFDHHLLKPCDPKEVIRLIEPLRRGQSGSAAVS